MLDALNLFGKDIDELLIFFFRVLRNFRRKLIFK